MKDKAVERLRECIGILTDYEAAVVALQQILDSGCTNYELDDLACSAATEQASAALARLRKSPSAETRSFTVTATRHEETTFTYPERGTGAAHEEDGA